MENIRFSNFLADLDDTLQDCEFYDDEKQETACSITEDELYNTMMNKDEWHLLGSDTVRQFTHIFMTDHRLRMALLMQFNVGA